MNYISPDIETVHARLLRVKELVTIAETATILTVSTRSVWSMIRRGDLDKVKIGGSARVTTSSVRELVYGWKYEDEEKSKSGFRGLTKPVACN